MRLDHITSFAFEHLLGRLLRRAVAFLLLALLILIALYHFTVAGTLTLEAHYGALYARLIVAGLYSGGAAVTVASLYATRIRPLSKQPAAGALAEPRNMQIAMLVEAVMLGYTLARKAPR